MNSVRWLARSRVYGHTQYMGSSVDKDTIEEKSESDIYSIQPRNKTSALSRHPLASLRDAGPSRRPPQPRQHARPHLVYSHSGVSHLFLFYKKTPPSFFLARASFWNRSGGDAATLFFGGGRRRFLAKKICTFSTFAAGTRSRTGSSGCSPRRASSTRPAPRPSTPTAVMSQTQNSSSTTASRWNATWPSASACVSRSTRRTRGTARDSSFFGFSLFFVRLGTLGGVRAPRVSFESRTMSLVLSRELREERRAQGVTFRERAVFGRLFFFAPVSPVSCVALASERENVPRDSIALFPRSRSCRGSVCCCGARTAPASPSWSSRRTRFQQRLDRRDRLSTSTRGVVRRQGGDFGVWGTMESVLESHGTRALSSAFELSTVHIGERWKRVPEILRQKRNANSVRPLDAGFQRTRCGSSASARPPRPNSSAWSGATTQRRRAGEEQRPSTRHTFSREPSLCARAPRTRAVPGLRRTVVGAAVCTRTTEPFIPDARRLDVLSRHPRPRKSP